MLNYMTVSPSRHLTVVDDGLEALSGALEQTCGRDARTTKTVMLGLWCGRPARTSPMPARCGS